MTISAHIVKYSINPAGKEIITYELEYPRFIHSELMTHRVFSRNAASSRAIPIRKAVKLIRENMAMPIHWGKNQRGMQAESQVSPFKQKLAKAIWVASGYLATSAALLLDRVGIHKQIANRIIEPWSHIKVVLTTTKLDNWNQLRLHPDAQPEIFELAKQMREVKAACTPTRLEWGQWHLPYASDKTKDIHQRLAQSASCCAQVSYRTLDESDEKSEKIYQMLVKADVLHASPFEHQARATQDGGTGNFTGDDWMQHRALIEESRAA